MKKLILITGIIILTIININAFEAVLIDFNNLYDTTVDFSESVDGAMWTEEQQQALRVNLKPADWRVRVNNSSWTKEARDKSYIIPVTNSLNYPNQTLLGIRIHFPQRYAHSHALVTPPFTIPPFYDDPDKADGMGTMFIHKGVVRNVGVLRKVSVRYLGNNFKYSLYVRIENERGEQRDIFVGYMDFVGWRTKSWLNPHIEHELKLRDAYRNARPYYPNEYPYIKFIAFVIMRSDPQITGNFITMIKEVSIEYDEAFLEVGKTEYLQEDIFGVYKEELYERAAIEMRDVHKRLYLEWLENVKQDSSVVTTRDKTIGN